MRRGKAFAALGATALEHKAAGLCAHPHPKPVSLGATAIIWLKSPLHTINLSISLSTEKSKAIGMDTLLSSATAGRRI